MVACDHVAWLQLAGAKDFTLSDTSRLKRVIWEMADPTSQTPSLLFFLGKKAKDVALRELFPRNNLKRNRANGFASVRLDTASISCNNPIIFADGAIDGTILPRQASSTCHENITHPIQWQSPNTRMIVDVVFARVILPFCSVLTLFADDFDNIDDITNCLVRWAAFGSFTNLPADVRPRLVIVLNEAKHGRQQVRELYVQLQERTQFRTTDLFSLVSTVYLSGESLSPLARHRPLKEEVFRQADGMREVYRRRHWLFSAVHLEALYREVLRHTASTITEPFSFIQATRKYQGLAADYSSHLQNFIRLGVKHAVPYECSASYVASSMMMDAYPPGAHLFEPRSVFQTVYKSACRDALKQVFDVESFVDYQCRRIENNFSSQFQYLETGHATSAELHWSNVRSKGNIWTTSKCNKSCLYCLLRSPEHVLDCGHAICDTCVRIFGKAMIGMEHHFSIDRCLLCVSRGSLEAKLKPPTSGVRLLSIDGGGTRGVVPLEFLMLLQEKLGSECALQDFFDLALGTSSGGLIVLILFLYRWDATRCSETFELIVKQFFSSRQGAAASLLSRLRGYFKCWISDGCYDTAALESCLKGVFGPSRRMFDAPMSGPSGTKVAVTATSISDASPFLFSNYNSPGTRKRACGYKLLRHENVQDEVCVWEAARATSAAPILFRPANIAAYGAFQDGGLKHNNPINLALWESRHVWPEHSIPDVVLSLGTGTPELQSPRAPHFRHFLNDGFIPRLCRSFMSSLDGENTWKEVENRLDDTSRQNYFRFNVGMTDAPSIDDVTCMETLRRSVHFQPSGPSSLAELVSALLISCFYFQLDFLPHFESGFYRCEGSIRCRNNGTTIVNAMKRVYTSQLEFVTDSGTLADFNGRDDVCTWCHRYSKRLVFYVRHPTDTMSMYLRTSDQTRRRISGFPQSIEWFVKQQRLDATFGLPDHGTPGALLCCKCDRVGFPMQKRKFIDVNRTKQKRMRLELGPSNVI
ncbi:hypothetical protein LTR04_002627 [Oleoguttula sp. CCFEE 6159]|nr:hypothetical protein LTR04_002627 [Oleoguttula sp. CCFEE 6159]